MMTDASKTKVEFASREWVARGRAFFIAEGARRSEEFKDLKFTFWDIFTNAPKHLAHDADGNINWTITFDHGRVDWQEGLFGEPNYTSKTSYEHGLGMVHIPSAELMKQAAAAGATPKSLPPILMETVGATHDHLIPQSI